MSIIVNTDNPVNNLTPTWRRYRTLIEDLGIKRGELAELQIHEKTQRVEAYAQVNGTSVSGKDREIDIIVLNITTDIINLKAEIQVMEDYKGLYELAIGHGVDLVG